MNTGFGIQISQRHEMLLSAKMVEELKILQMSHDALIEYINAQLIENPVLEKDDDQEDLELPCDDDSNDYENNYEYNHEYQIPKIDFTQYKSKPTTLRQHLLLQIRELFIEPDIRKIAIYLIETIKEDGYLGTSINDVSYILKVPVQKVKTALRVVQNLEPFGIGARSLKECILIQLRQRNELDATSKVIVMNYLELIAEKKYGIIAEKLGLSLEHVMDIHKKIKSTEPRPGIKFFCNSEVYYIQPELTVKMIENKFEVMFANDNIINLKVNDFYKRLIKNNECSKDIKKYLKFKESKAEEIINAVEQRRRTILNVVGYIIEYQEDFLKKGAMFLKPLTLKMVANKVNLHESTVSRSVDGKYIQTPRGLYDLKFFFSSQIDCGREAGISANAVKIAIRDIIRNEDKKNPLSDELIKKFLEDSGIRIARRTVAKYRESMSILPAKMRII